MKKVWWKTLGLAGIALVFHCGPTEVNSAGGSPTLLSVCHRGQTLQVTSAVYQAHLNHGDSPGACIVSPNQNP